jgi:hypothetical protein
MDDSSQTEIAVASRLDQQFALRIVDLNEITVIDKSGEEVLSMMICDGATFVATGLYTRHLLKALRERTANSPMQD